MSLEPPTTSDSVKRFTKPSLWSQTLEQCRLDLKFSELTRMPACDKGMKRIGRVIDIEFSLKDRLITKLVVKVNGEDKKES